jgi:hypothetical protein
MKRSASSPKTLRNKKQALLLSFLIMALVSGRAEAGTYAESLRYGLKRGVKNALSSPAEILIGIQDYHERAGWPYARQGIGFLVGTGKMLLRLGSGVVDLGAAWIPGLQEGLPVEPETLF